MKADQNNLHLGLGPNWSKRSEISDCYLLKWQYRDTAPGYLDDRDSLDQNWVPKIRYHKPLVMSYWVLVSSFWSPKNLSHRAHSHRNTHKGNLAILFEKWVTEVWNPPFPPYVHVILLVYSWGDHHKNVAPINQNTPLNWSLNPLTTYILWNLKNDAWNTISWKWKMVPFQGRHFFIFGEPTPGIEGFHRSQSLHLYHDQTTRVMGCQCHV